MKLSKQAQEWWEMDNKMLDQLAAERLVRGIVEKLQIEGKFPAGKFEIHFTMDPNESIHPTLTNDDPPVFELKGVPFPLADEALEKLCLLLGCPVRIFKGSSDDDPKPIIVEDKKC
jgi:hypothetical protein